MGRYAERTEVAPNKSRAEIEAILARYGATKFLYGWEERRAMLAFEMRGRRIQVALPLPDPADDAFRLTPSRKWERTEAQAREAWQQAVKQRWRALALVVKAKLEAIEAGIVDFDTEWLGFIALPDGRTVGEFTVPQVEEVYRTGRLPALLPGASLQLPGPSGGR